VPVPIRHNTQRWLCFPQFHRLVPPDPEAVDIHHHMAAAAPVGRVVGLEDSRKRAEADTRAEADNLAAELAGTKVERPDNWAAVADRPGAVAQAAVLHKRVAGPRTRAAEEHRVAAAALRVRFRTPAADYIGAARQDRLHKLVERRRLAVAARPVLVDKGPAVAHRVPSGKRQARWGLVALLLL
jgi:hypothetical protein